MHMGSCLCGAVSFEVAGALVAPIACHCSQCRKQSGHYWAAMEIPRSAVTITGLEHVTWYAASAQARRGFCAQCGSFLFWDPADRDSLDVAAGAFDGPTGVRLASHIFVADKGDYYEIADGLPQNEQ